MATHRFEPTHYHTTLGSHDPVLRVADGDTIVTTTVDAGGHDASGTQVTPGGNPQTGPFYVAGAEPGDTLVVHLDRLTPNRATGYSATILAPHVVDPQVLQDWPDGAPGQWRIDVAQGTATLIAPDTALDRFAIPLQPMLGCFGVAPPDGQAISTATSGVYGGNMDYRGFTAGVTVYFPVFVPGALLHLGDGHAAQGDGELLGTGIEISLEVQVTVHLRKGRCGGSPRGGWPRGENATHIFSVGNARPLDQATQHATTEMLGWLRDEYRLDVHAASILLGMCGEYDLGNVFDPAYTMVCKVPKRVLPPR